MGPQNGTPTQTTAPFPLMGLGLNQGAQMVEAPPLRARVFASQVHRTSSADIEQGAAKFDALVAE